MKIFIATPMYGGNCTGTYANSLMQVPGALYNHDIDMQYRYLTNDALITRARNQLTYDFIQSDCTHLMFIDADIGFNAQDIPYMMSLNEDIVCGIYPKKCINWNTVATAAIQGFSPSELSNHTGDFVVNYYDKVDNGLITIENGGTGFMLIKRNVITTLIPKVDSYMFDGYNQVDVANGLQSYRIPEIFNTCICPITYRLLSEDYYFCKLTRDNGYKIKADTNIKLTHTGSYVFNGTI